MKWPVGGKRQSKAQRQEILRIYFEESPQAATKLAISRGLSPMYAYKIAHESGLMPRLRKEWGKYRESLGREEAKHA